MAVLADRCINPNCRELIRYEEGTQEIRCPWCDHAFLSREFEGEQRKIVEALMAGKQARDALAMERREKEALQALLNKSQQAWIDYADVRQHVKEQLRKIEKNTVDIKSDTKELLAGQKDILREVKENRRVNEAENQQLSDEYERGRRRDAEEREQLRQEFARQREQDAKEREKLQREIKALRSEVNRESVKEIAYVPSETPKCEIQQVVASGQVRAEEKSKAREPREIVFYGLIVTAGILFVVNGVLTEKMIEYQQYALLSISWLLFTAVLCPIVMAIPEKKVWRILAYVLCGFWIFFFSIQAYSDLLPCDADIVLRLASAVGTAILLLIGCNKLANWMNE